MISQNMNTKKRIKEELDDLNNNPLTNISLTAGLVDNNLFEWQCTILGPNDSPYAGGLFYLKVYFPDDYPNNPPEVCFKTPIYHLNVNPRNCENSIQPEKLGHLCMSTLNWWKPKYTMREVLSNIFSFFYRANPESPFGLERRTEFEENRALYEEKAKYFTQLYANASRKEDFEFEDKWDFTY